MGGGQTENGDLQEMVIEEHRLVGAIGMPLACTSLTYLRQESKVISNSFPITKEIIRAKRLQ